MRKKIIGYVTLFALLLFLHPAGPWRRMWTFRRRENRPVTATSSTRQETLKAGRLYTKPPCWIKRSFILFLFHCACICILALADLGYW